MWCVPPANKYKLIIRLLFCGLMSDLADVEGKPPPMTVMMNFFEVVMLFVRMLLDLCVCVCVFLLYVSCKQKVAGSLPGAVCSMCVSVYVCVFLLYVSC